jgi:HK97 gp10 family phage protein
VSAAINFTVDQAALDKLFGSVSSPIGVLITKLCIKIEGKAKEYCPVDTGRLRSSITHEVTGQDRTIVGTVGTNVEYAGFVEFGTRYMHAQSYLRRALHEVVPQ